MARPIITNFSSGEISPLSYDRIDLTVYQNACKYINNFFHLPQGGIVRRPGTYFVAETKDSALSADKTARLLAYHFSNSQAYVIEMGDGYFRFFTENGQIVAPTSPAPDTWLTATYYRDGNFVTDTAVVYRCILAHTSAAASRPGSGASWATYWVVSSLLEIAHTFTEAQIADIQYDSCGDILYLVHQDVFPKQLERRSHTEWRLSDLGLSPPPIIDLGVQPTQALTLTPAATTGDSVNFTLSGAGWWLSGDKDRSIRCDNGGEAVIRSITSVNIAVCHIAKPFPNTNAIPSGEWKLYGHADGLLHDDNNQASLGKGNIITIELWNEGDDHVYGWHARDVGRYIKFWDGCAKILTVQSSNLITAEIVSAPSKTLKHTDDVKDMCPNWEMGDSEFDATRGYPSAIGFFENRLVLANTKEKPTGLFASQSSDFTNFGLGTLANNGLSYVIGVGNGIQWVAGLSNLMAGTLKSEWKIGSGVAGDSLNSTNMNAKIMTSNGSRLMQAVLGFDAILYVQRGGLKVRKMEYAFEKDTYPSTDITNLAEHITEGGINRLSLLQEPNVLLLALKQTGELLTVNLTGMVNNGQFVEIAGWNRFNTDGIIESMAVISKEDTEDQLWMIVKRDIGGVTKRFVEYMKPFAYGDEPRDYFGVDCGLTYDGGAAVTISAATTANPVAITTSTAHGFTDGWKVRIRATGMTEINENVYIVAGASTYGFHLHDLAGAANVNGTAYTAFVAGTVERVVNSVSGLDHLIGETVDIQADGLDNGTAVVSGAGAVTLNGTGEAAYANTIHVGLNYSADMHTVPVAKGKTIRIDRAWARFYETIGPIKMGYDADHLVTANLGTNLDYYTLKKGLKEIQFNEPYDFDSGSVYIQQPRPLPMKLLSLIYSVKGSEE